MKTGTRYESRLPSENTIRNFSAKKSLSFSTAKPPRLPTQAGKLSAYSKAAAASCGRTDRACASLKSRTITFILPLQKSLTMHDLNRPFCRKDHLASPPKPLLT